MCDNRKIIAVIDEKKKDKNDKCKKRKYTLNNQSQKYICTIRLDDCFVPNEKGREKCDYLIINCDDNVAYFVELKGQKIFKAIEQITQSIRLLSDKLTGCKINARIVLSEVNTPNLENNPKIQRFEKLLRGYNGNFAKGTIQLEEAV
ncbi:MAG: hypothetical protein HQK96_06350 [Nitrospirae bacterium]|nr:hypothetical protein [Nitrospirota bacterium]